MAPKLSRPVNRARDDRYIEQIIAHERQISAGEERLIRIIDETAREVEAEQKGTERRRPRLRPHRGG